MASTVRLISSAARRNRHQGATNCAKQLRLPDASAPLLASAPARISEGEAVQHRGATRVGLRGMRQLERLPSKFNHITVHADLQRCIVRGRVHHELSKGTDDRIRVAWCTTSAVAKQTLARELRQLRHQGWRSTQVAVKLGSALMYVTVITQQSGL